MACRFDLAEMLRKRKEKEAKEQKARDAQRAEFKMHPEVVVGEMPMKPEDVQQGALWRSRMRVIRFICRASGMPLEVSPRMRVTVCPWHARGSILSKR
jgi:ribosomal protein L16/L10AE